MNTNFEKCLDWVLAHEGGFANHPNDPGGATNRGITHRTYDAYRRRKGLSPRHVRDISQEEVVDIYRRQYWDAVRGDELPSGLDYAVFDFAVNSGPSRAIKFMQRSVGADPDGVIGDQTLEAVEGSDPEQAIKDICTARFHWLKGLRTFRTFGRGWTRRVMGESMGVQARDTGVIDRAAMLACAEENIPAPAMRDDGAAEKATNSTRSFTRSLLDGFRSGGRLQEGGLVAVGVSALTQLEGPIAYAVAGAIVIAVVVAGCVIVSKVLPE